MNAKNGPMPQTPHSTSSPGSIPRRWISDCRGAGMSGPPPAPVRLSGGSVSGARRLSPTDSAAIAAATSQTAAKPEAASAASPINGPIAVPRYTEIEMRLIASPRRCSGARSVAAARAATKNSASPTPNRRRMTISNGMLTAARWPAAATTVMTAPTTSAIFRPPRSAKRPANGRISSDDTANAPMTIPTATSSPPSGPTV
ncbi:MAG: hypothetical protein M5U05_19185 [Anaerolineales bacterium]|nr:hypothetical protein [Anaerolineales bacterium]